MSGLAVSSYGSLGRLSSVTRDCLVSNCVCSVSSIVWGLDVISLVSGNLIGARLGWSFASGRSPAIV